MKPESNKLSGFTIIELIVAVAILLLLITAIGAVFRSASRSVGTSQALLMEMLSNSGAVQAQLESDVSHMNKNGFLVIRCGTYTDSTDPTHLVTRRCDQMCFLATGVFPHRTGTANASPFTDVTTSSNACIWWGQLAFELGSGKTAAPTNPRISLNADVTTTVPLNQVPTGLVDSTSGLLESSFVLGRDAVLLVPENSGTSNESPVAGTSIAAYRDVTTTPNYLAIDWHAAAISPLSAEAKAATPFHSRLDAAAVSPPEIASFLTANVVGIRGSTGLRYEADEFCFRRSSLRSPLDSEAATGTAAAQLLNGYFRMHPIALQGVSSIAIDWTDGSTYAGGEVNVIDGSTVAVPLATDPKSTRWYGMYVAPSATTVPPAVGLARGATFAPYLVDGPISTTTSAVAANGDTYTALFSVDNRTSWPVALRIRYHIADPTGRLANGRDVVQIIKLPS